MDCRDIDRALTRDPNSVAPQLLELAQEHLTSCERCRALIQAMNANGNQEEPSAERLLRIEQSLKVDFGPVRPIWPSSHFFAAFAGIFVLIVAIGAYRMGAFAISVMTPLQTAAILAGLAASASLLAYSLVHQMVPGSRHRISPEFVPAGVMVLLLLAITGLFQFQHDPRFWARSWACFSAGTPYALFATVPFWLLLRRGAILSPRMTGAAAGLLAGLVGTSVLEIHCPNLDAWHILLGHLGVSVLGAIAGLAIGYVGELAVSRQQ